MNVREKILLAACDLPQHFAVEALCVRAWEMDQKTFGLRGYESQYPDSNRVLSKLFGAAGVQSLGWLAYSPETVGARCVTLEGRSVAARLRGAPVERKPRREVVRAQVTRAVLTDAEARAVCALASTESCRKMLRGVALSAGNARAFWVLGRTLRVEDVGALLRRAVDSLGGEQDLRLPPLVTCYALHSAHRMMAARFSRELAEVTT